MARISVIIPAYRSHATVAVTLDSLLRQTRPADEIVLVDSSPNDATSQAVAPFLAHITLIRPGERLYPHEARNRGAQHATGDLLVFTDPDIVARPNWLAQLEAAWQAADQIIVGAVDCAGRHWLDVGIHLCKFDSWLPGGTRRRVEIGPSVNFGLARAIFEHVGGFPNDPMLGDTTLSWTLHDHGHALWFVPQAVVSHQHDQRVRDLVRERASRGREFGLIRLRRGRWTGARVGLWLVISLLPLRLAKLMLRRVRNAARAGWLGWLALTWPVVLLGEIGWLWGESAAYAAELRSRWRTRRNTR